MLRLLLAGAAILVVATLGSMFAAANTVPATNAGVQTFAITAQSLAPSQCAGMSLTAIVTNLSGGVGNELVLGTAAAETINGNGGNDCVIGGGGGDTLRGGTGTDVCIGGPGTDFFNSCETQVQ